MIIFPFLFFFALFFFLFSITKKPGRSFFISCLVWALVLLFITELLSFFYLLTSFWVSALWLLGIAVLLLLQIFYKSNFLLSVKEWRRAFSFRKKQEAMDMLMLCIIFFIVSILCATALLAPPNTWDSMTYHMTRSFFWTQHQSTALYPTSNPQQLSFSPWAEYVITHYNLLWNGIGLERDRLANMAQFFAMLFSLLGVSLIAKELGAKRKAQILSALFCAAIPMGILQASSTQNDYAAAFCFLLPMYFLLAYRKSPNDSNLIFFSLSLGLALLTKGTNYIYLTPLLMYFAFFTFKNKVFFKSLAIGTVLYLFVNIIFYARNYSIFNTPLYASNTNVQVQDLSKPFTLLFLGPLKNILMHLQFPYFWRINNWIEQAVKYVSETLGISFNHANFNDIAFYIPHKFLHEDTAGNLIALLCIVLALSILFIFPRKLEEAKLENLEGDSSKFSSLKLYSCLLIFSFFLFSVLLRWQPWISRLQLTLFVAFAPLVGITFSVFKKKGMLLFCGLLFLSALPHLLFNSSRPLLKRPVALPQSLEKVSLFAHSWPPYSIWETKRKELYFTNRPKLAQEYTDTIEKVKQLQCSQIGFLSGIDAWEYPLALFLKEAVPDLWIQHIPSSLGERGERVERLPLFKDFAPCLLVSIASDHGKKIEYKGWQFTRIANQSYLDLYKR